MNPNDMVIRQFRKLINRACRVELRKITDKDISFRCGFQDYGFISCVVKYDTFNKHSPEEIAIQIACDVAREVIK